MAQPVLAQSPTQLERFCALQGTSTLSATALKACAADAHWMVLDGTKVRARCSLWWTQVPPSPDKTLGVIGHYAALDAEAGAQLLAHACEQLAERGCTQAVGPMDGDTWHSYRLVSERGSEPPFFLEPWHPEGWPEHFEAAGFGPLAHYFSALNADLQQDPRLAALTQIVEDQGIRIRALDPARFERELQAIYEVSLASFKRNFLYTPISLEQFIDLYQPVRPYVQPELVMIAQRQGQPVGYQFSIPDLLQVQRGQNVNTMIVKTVAVHPEFGGSGLGSLLVAKAHQVAKTFGFARAIHALMVEDNLSRKISAHYAEPMRRYTLFAKEL